MSAAFTTARIYFVLPESSHRAALEGGGAPADWLATEALGPRREGHYAWVGLVRSAPAGAFVARCEGPVLRVQGFVLPALRGLGLATEALDGLADALLVRLGHVPTPDPRVYTPFQRRDSPSRIVIEARHPAAARVAERAGARLVGDAWVLDLVGHTGLDRPAAIDGDRVARLLASLRPEQAPALEAAARAHRDRLLAAIRAAEAKAKARPKAEYRGVQELVDRPPAEPATAADVSAALEHCWAGRLDAVIAALGRRLFSDAQIEELRSAIDDSYLSERERTPELADIRAWLWDYVRVRRG